MIGMELEMWAKGRRNEAIRAWIGARDGGRTPVRGDSCVHFQPSRRQNRSVAPDFPAARLSPVPACVA